MMNDPFAVLGLTSSATEDEIKSAYRKLAKKYHPDLNPGDKNAEQKMREINEAYTQALQIKRGGSSSPFGAGQQSGPWGPQQSAGGPQYEYRWDTRQDPSGNPFGDFVFDPFAAFFGGAAGQRQSSFRRRTFANQDLESAAEMIKRAETQKTAPDRTD